MSGQTCNERIESARVLYDQGHLQQVLDTLDGCETSSADEKFARYRLLALANLAMNKSEVAREWVILMLELKPAYNPSSTQYSQEFIRLVQSVVVIPKFSFGLSAAVGTSLSIPHVTARYSSLYTTEVSYVGKNAFMLEFQGGYQLSEHLGLFANFWLMSKRYAVDYSVDQLTLSAEETLLYASIPLGLRLMGKKSRKMEPFAEVGVVAGRLIQARSDHHYFNALTNISSDLTDVPSFDRRKKMDIGLLLGAGGLYRIKGGNLFIRAFYYHSQSTITDASKRYSNNELLARYYYLDDDLSLSNVGLTFGYTRILNYRVKHD
ncbi:MAG: outer membrane beta-barrel protein [Flavobacteriales bacterium]|nr:outer membrane beta-barrel protein [Flavobacteriales bacterium]